METLTPCFTGVRDVVIEIITRTDDLTLFSFAGVNRYTNKVCNEEFWQQCFYRKLGLRLSGEVSYRRIYYRLARVEFSRAEIVKLTVELDETELTIRMMELGDEKGFDSYFYTNTIINAANMGSQKVLTALKHWADGPPSPKRLVFNSAMFSIIPSCLNTAVAHNQIETVRTLLDIGADIGGLETLKHAVYCKYYDLLTLLIDRGVKDNNCHAISTAIGQDDAALVTLLITRKVVPDLTHTLLYNLFDIAIEGGAINTVEYFMRHHGLNGFHYRELRRISPITAAIAAKQTKLALHFVERGLPIEHDVWEMIIRKDDVTMVTALLKRGYMNRVNIISPLSLAIVVNNVPIVSLFLQYCFCIDLERIRSILSGYSLNSRMRECLERYVRVRTARTLTKKQSESNQSVGRR